VTAVGAKLLAGGSLVYRQAQVYADICRQSLAGSVPESAANPRRCRGRKAQIT